MIRKLHTFQVLKSSYAMTDMGVLCYYLGIHFHQKDEFIVMSQPKYILKLLTDSIGKNANQWPRLWKQI